MPEQPNTDVAVRPTGALTVQPDQRAWTQDQRAALAQIGVEEASDGDLAVFLNYAQRTGLDPWTRQLYMIGRNSKNQRTQQWETKYTIQASIDGLRIVAQRTGEYAGQVGPEWCGPDGKWRDVWLGDTPPAAARVGVLRRGWAQPQYAVAVFREYVGTDSKGNVTRMWREKPAVMIAKCAEALALRKAFPHDLSGIYTSDEMARADEAQPGPTPVPAPVAAVEPGRDWLAAVYDCDDPQELRALWVEAAHSGDLTKGSDLEAAFLRHAEALTHDAAVTVDADAALEVEGHGTVAA